MYDIMQIRLRNRITRGREDNIYYNKSRLYASYNNISCIYVKFKGYGYETTKYSLISFGSLI